MTNRTAQVNQIRGFLGEFGCIVSKGLRPLRRELPEILEDAENGLPHLARTLLSNFLEQLRALDDQIEHYDRQIAQLARESEPAQRLMAIEGRVTPICRRYSPTGSSLCICRK